MASSKNSKILICDDDETLCYLLKEQLLEEGFEVEIVYDGKYAIDAIWQDLNDENGLVKDCKIGKSLGYAGKSIIHPNQIHIAHSIFKPNQTEIDWAKKVCQVYENSIKKNKGATVVEGKMIDEVHYKRAKSLLDSIKNS